MIKELDIDVMAITETWLNVENYAISVNELLPNNMKFFGRHRENGKGGGVGICLKDSLCDSIVVNNDDKKQSCEHLSLSLKKDNLEVKILVIYRLLTKNNFIEELDEILSELCIGSHFVMVGTHTYMTHQKWCLIFIV